MFKVSAPCKQCLKIEQLVYTLTTLYWSWLVQAIFIDLSSTVDSTPDNSSLQGKLAKGSSYWSFELSRVKLCGNSLNGKRKFVRLSARFELTRVRGIRSRLISLLLLVMHRKKSIFLNELD